MLNFLPIKHYTEIINVCSNFNGSAYLVIKNIFWQLIHRSRQLLETVTIAIVGKYVNQNSSEAYASVIKSLEHAAINCWRKLKYVFVESEFLEQEAKTKNPSSYFDAWKKISDCK